MCSLRKLQLEMERAIVAPQMELVPQALISDHFSGRERLSVYRNNFALGHHEALAAVYPVIKRLVGDDFFEMLATAYRRHDLRSNANVHAYGAALAEFLEDYSPAASLPYLPDIARLEWAYHEAFHAGSEPDVTVALDAAVMTGDEVLLPHPALRWLESPYPVLEIWRRNRRDQVEPEEIALDRGGDRLIIYRTALDVELARLGTAEYSLVTALAQGMSISRAFAIHADQTDIANTLAFCLSHGIFTGFKTGGMFDESTD